MLTPTELATLRAALRYWSDEMGTSGLEAVRHYFDDDVQPLLSDYAIERLRQQLITGNLRYLICEGQRPISMLLLAPPSPCEPGQRCVTVILDQ